MRILIGFIVLVLLVFAGTSHSAPPDIPKSPANLGYWLRMSAPSFGCMLEKQYGYIDARFNCHLTDYHNKGDPCNNSDEYYEGPEFPKELIQRIHPLATNIELSWEHGELQQITLFLNGKFSDSAVRRAFSIPDDSKLPRNVMRVDVDTDNRNSTSISVTGFDHQGTGDVECPVE